MSTSILVVDDHVPYRDAVRSLLEQEPDLEVVAAAGDLEAAVAAAAATKPEVAVIDLVLPGTSGLDATRAILAVEPACRVLATSIHFDRRLVAEAFAAGATGCIRKEAGAAELVAAVRTIAAGRTYLGSGLTPP